MSKTKPRPPVAPNRPNDFQTPPFALVPLLPYLPAAGRIWEPSAGKGNLVREMRRLGFDVISGDILTGQDFFQVDPPAYDVLVTNPPFSVKDAYLTRCYALGKPFALLMPLTALGEQARLALYRMHGIELIIPDRRWNFETPSGEGAGAYFMTAWFTWGLNIGRDLTFAVTEKLAQVQEVLFT